MSVSLDEKRFFFVFNLRWVEVGDLARWKTNSIDQETILEARLKRDLLAVCLVLLFGIRLSVMLNSE